MITKWFFSGALLEPDRWGGSLSDPSVQHILYLYLLPYSLAAVLLAAVLWLFLPTRYKSPLPWSPLLLFSFIFFIPVVGAVGAILGIFLALHLPRHPDEQGWQVTPIAELPFRAIEERRSPLFHDGSLQDVLQLATDPEQRLSALLATKGMAGKEAIPLLQLALRDADDDVRLLAYSMLDQRENAINQQIERLLEVLADNAESPHAIHAALGRWYWELAHLGLAQGAVLEHILGQALVHVRAALEGRSEPASELLAGRILLAMEDAAGAREHLQRAAAVGVSTSKLAPFFAEEAFIARRYTDIAGHLQAISPEHHKDPRLAASVRYWL